MRAKTVHVIGTGTIGEPLIGVLASFRKSFGIDEVTFHKRTPSQADRAKVGALVQSGAKLCVDQEQWGHFGRIGLEPCREAQEAIERMGKLL